MYPINQVFLGNDPLLTHSNSINNINSIDEQIQYLEKQRQLIEASQFQNNQAKIQSTKIWNEIDNEISPLSNEQKQLLFQNQDYLEIYNQIQNLVQQEILNLVKSKIENSKEGKELLEQQLKLVKKLKSNIIDSTNREMELFRNFKEFSKHNPNVTYDEFIKSNINK